MLIEFSDDYHDAGTSHQRLDNILDLVGTPRVSIRRTAVPLVAHAGPLRDQISIIVIAMTDRVGQITVHRLALLTSPWEESLAHTSDETIVSLVRRTATQYPWPKVEGELNREIERLNSILLASVFDEMTRIVRQSFDDSSGGGTARREAFERVLDTRSRLHNTMAHLKSNNLGEGSTVQELHMAISGCDALTTSLAGMTAVIMQEQAELHDAQQRDRDSELLHRDRVLARVAAALLLPGLWLALLGTNILPLSIGSWPIQSWKVVVASVLIAIALGAAAWWSLPVLSRRFKDPRNK